MSALAVLVIVAFGLVALQAVLFWLAVIGGSDDDAVEVTTLVSFPLGLVIVAAFIVALAQSCGEEPGEPVAAEVQAR